MAALEGAQRLVQLEELSDEHPAIRPVDHTIRLDEAIQVFAPRRIPIQFAPGPALPDIEIVAPCTQIAQVPVEIAFAPPTTRAGMRALP
jgi:hypothetical protein